jgi:hypothetical protein
MFLVCASAVHSVVFSAWLVACVTVASHVAFAQSDVLASWNDGAVKSAIVDFVGRVLQWTMARQRPHFAGIVHHTDAEREYAYDRDSKIGKLDKALDEAAAKGWVVVDMKRDWKAVFPDAK